MSAGGATPDPTADLLVAGAALVATCDDEHRELAGGWVAITDGVISGVGAAGDEPAAIRTIRADGCLVTPGLVNTHHHIYQNLTRAYRPATSSNLFGWLTTLYPIWAGLDEEAAYLSAWVGLAELALGGCTTSMDHLYVHPAGGGDLIAAEIRAATELGVRFHATRGSMSRSQKDGGLPPDSVVQDDETILAESERLVAAHHRARAPGHDAGGAGAMLALLGHARAHAGDRRAGRAARRPAPHPSGRGRRRGQLLPRRLRLSTGRAVRGRRLGNRPLVGGALRLPERGRDRPSRPAGAPASPTAPARTR